LNSSIKLITSIHCCLLFLIYNIVLFIISKNFIYSKYYLATLGHPFKIDNMNFGIKNVLYGRSKLLIIIFIVLIISISYGLFFVLQNINEQNVRKNLFDQQKDRQLDTTKSLSQHVSSDMTLVATRLEGLANSLYLQQGNLYSNKTRQYIENNFLEMSGIIDRLLTANTNGTVTIDIGPKGEKTFVGANISHREYIKEAKSKLSPFFSSSFKGLDGNYRIGISYPIINRDTGEYKGVVAALIPTVKFFSHYGNIYNIDLRFLVAYDRNGNYIATPRTQFLGKNFFGNEVQQFFHHNNIQNNIYRQVFSGQLVYAVYDFGSGERLNTGSPIFLSGKPAYFIFIVTPTSTIYSTINDSLLKQRVETFSLLAGTTAAIIMLIVFLKSANEELIKNERSKEEFISMVSHELKTPIVPMKMYAEMFLYTDSLGPMNEKQNKAIQAIYRSIQKLELLVSDVMDVYKLDMGKLRFSKVDVDVASLINQTLSEMKPLIVDKQIELKSDVKVAGGVFCDPERIEQVLSNLIKNSIDFVPNKEGKIIIRAEKGEDSKVTFTVEDNGTGIKPDKASKLFRKFYQIDTSATRKHGGTGLGLAICKGIVEAHGGSIWVDKNYANGTAIKFTLPDSQLI
jgi:signal transduction histidine kinase